MREISAKKQIASDLEGGRKAQSLRERGQVWWRQLMRLFFTNKTSVSAQKVAELQRRACWVGIAVILQFWNETLRVVFQRIESKYTSTVTLLDPTSNLILIALIVGSFLALWMAFRPVPAKKGHQNSSEWPSRWQLWVCSVCLVLALIGAGAALVSIVRCFMPMQFSNDGTVLDTNAAVVLLHGDDPYARPTLANLNLMHDVSLHAEWTTPLRRGSFAGKLEYPTNEELEAALQSGLKTAHAQEFETKVSYPALAFISLVPFALFNHFNVLPLYILSHLLLIAIAWKYARPELRPWILLLAFANVSIWTTTVGETLDMFYISLLTLSWLVSHRRWWSLVLLGLAVASKQTAWFFIPFYAMMIYWQYGFKEALLRVVAALGIGLAINLPFIIWGPSDWLAGVTAPLVDPMFPMGTGLIALSTGHVLPYLPDRAYQILEWTAYGLFLIYYWFRCRRVPEAAMLLAVLFLFFAWRSLPSYFYCSAFPLLVLMLKKPIPDQIDSVPQASAADAKLSPTFGSQRQVLSPPAQIFPYYREATLALATILYRCLPITVLLCFVANRSMRAILFRLQMTYTVTPNWCIMRMQTRRQCTFETFEEKI